MAVSNVTPSIQYTGNGNNTDFAFTFVVPALQTGNTITDATASITSGSTTLTTTTSDFFYTSSLQGKSIVVNGAGAGGANLETTINTRTSGTVVELVDAASTTVSNATITVTTGLFGTAMKDTGDLKVFVDGVLKTYTTDYTVILNVGDESNKGGTVQFVTAPASSTTVTIVRDVELQRTVDFQRGGALTSKDLNAEFDNIVMAVQDSIETGTQTLKFPADELVSEANSTLPSATNRANKLLAFNSSGVLNLTSDITSGDGNVSANVITANTATITNITGALTGDVTGTVSSLSNHTTDNLTEGSNLYYTAARDTAQFNTDLASKTTDNLTEGTNLYYTNTRADARIGAASIGDLSDVDLTGVGNTMILSYNTSTSQFEPVASTLGLSAQSPLVYNSATATLSLPNLSTFTTSNLTEGTNLYYTDTRFDNRLATKSTTNLTEGTNLYYTDARADARIANNIIDEDDFATDSNTRAPSQQSTKAYIQSQIETKDNTDEITEGSTNLYFTNARADARVNAVLPNTGSLTEGSNLYFTDARADARVNLQTGANLDLSNKSTSDLSEGTNLYYTDARAQAVSINNLVEDTTPQLGGTLDTQSNIIEGGTINIQSTSNHVNITAANNGVSDIHLKTQGAGYIKLETPSYPVRMISPLAPTIETHATTDQTNNIDATLGKKAFSLFPKLNLQYGTGSENLVAGHQLHADWRDETAGSEETNWQFQSYRAGDLQTVKFEGNQITAQDINLFSNAVPSADCHFRFTQSGGGFKSITSDRTETITSGNEHKYILPALFPNNGNATAYLKVSTNNDLYGTFRDEIIIDPANEGATGGYSKVLVGNEHYGVAQITGHTYADYSAPSQQYGTQLHLNAQKDSTNDEFGGDVQITFPAVDDDKRGRMWLWNSGLGTEKAVEITAGTPTQSLETSNGRLPLVLSQTDVTASGATAATRYTRRGHIKIKPGTNADIEITPDGTGKVKIDGLNYPTADGTNGQVLQTDGAGNLSFATVSGGGGGGISNVVEDSTPQLGGNLDVNGNNIISQSNGNITIEPDGSGSTNMKRVRLGQGDSGIAIRSSDFADMADFVRESSSHYSYSLQVASDSTSDDLAAGNAGGAFGFTAMSDSYSPNNNQFYIGSINGVIGDTGNLDGSTAGENNNAIRMYTYSDNVGYALNNVGEFRHGTTKLMNEKLVFSRSGDDITVSTTSNGDINFTPDGTGQFKVNGSVVGNTPAFEAYASSDLTLSNNVHTKQQYNTEVFDTDNAYDNSNYRFQPTVAGRYFVYASTKVEANASSLQFVQSSIYKNGSQVKEQMHDARNNNGLQFSVFVSAIIDFDGSGDYVEGYVKGFVTGGNVYSRAGNKSTSFGAFRIT